MCATTDGPKRIAGIGELTCYFTDSVDLLLDKIPWVNNTYLILLSLFWDITDKWYIIALW